MITVIAIENVLARGEDLRTAAPTKASKALYAGFRSQTNCVGLTRSEMDIARWWLKREHFDDWASILSYPPSSLTWDHWRTDQIRGLLAEGWEIFTYIDTNAYVIDEVRAMGVTTMCISYPHQPPGWKEVVTPRTWSDVVSTLEDKVP